MSVILKNSSNVIQYIFPKGTELIEEPWGKRLDTVNRAYQAGAVMTGDEKVEPRIVSLRAVFSEADINTTYGATFDANVREMRQQCYTEDLRLYIQHKYPDEFYLVECLYFELTHLTPVAAEVNIDFLVADPFRYYMDTTTDSNTVDSDPETFTVTNGGDVEVFPVITWTGGAGSDVDSILITNTTDDGANCTYTPAAGLTTGHIVEIDCEAGTVKLNTGGGLADSIVKFSGEFLRLLPGDNSITVDITNTVGTNTCAFVFRKRYL